jgi:hypothetical protein
VNEDDLRGVVNRAVLVVRAAEPFIGWAAKVTGPSIEETRGMLSHDRTGVGRGQGSGDQALLTHPGAQPRGAWAGTSWILRFVPESLDKLRGRENRDRFILRKAEEILIPAAHTRGPRRNGDGEDLVVVGIAAHRRNRRRSHKMRLFRYRAREFEPQGLADISVEFGARQGDA